MTKADGEPITLADLIQRHRDATGDSYMTIARRAGMSKARVGQLATADSPHMPRAETIDKLARGLRLPVNLVKEAAMASAGVRPANGTDQRVSYIAARLGELDGDDLDTVASVVESLLNRRRG